MQFEMTSPTNRSEDPFCTTDDFTLDCVFCLLIGILVFFSYTHFWYTGEEIETDNDNN